MKKILFTMAFLNMAATIVIGQVHFTDINSFEVEQSITELNDNATITLPRNYQLLEGKPVKDFINVGDKATIVCGYQETGIAVEYTGYVKEIAADVPLVITCDEVYPFRKTNLIKSYRSVKLRQLLEDVVQGITAFNGQQYVIECPDVQLGKYVIDNASAYQVLTKLKQDFGFFSKINNNTLHVGFAYDWQPDFTTRHQYNLQTNVKGKSDLKFKASGDFNTQVKVTIKYPDGRTEVVKSGSTDDDAAVKTITTGAMDLSEAQKIADARLKKYTYSGYTGSITGFGVPRVKAGDTVEITDTEYPERNGVYLVEKLTLRYSDSGIERQAELSFKV
jgi:phage protein D